MEIPLKNIRRELGRIERAKRKLKEIQRSIPLPSGQELEAMISGSRPLSKEVYVVAVLQAAELSLEEGTLDIRSDLSKAALKKPSFWGGSQGTDLSFGDLIAAVRQEREARR